MGNKNLNDKYGIPFLSKWKHKDGGIYTAFKVEYSFKNTVNIPIVFYMKQLSKEEELKWKQNGIINGFVRTVAHFKSSFTID